MNPSASFHLSNGGLFVYLSPDLYTLNFFGGGLLVQLPATFQVQPKLRISSEGGCQFHGRLGRDRSSPVDNLVYCWKRLAKNLGKILLHPPTPIKRFLDEFTRREDLC